MNLLGNRDLERSVTAVNENTLLTAAEIAALRSLAADEGLRVCIAHAQTLHLHIKVNDTNRLPVAVFAEAGGVLDHARDGYVKYRFPGGINMIFSHIAVSVDDQAEELPNRRPRPFLDHIGIDMRADNEDSRDAFDALPAIARQRGWAHVPQGGKERAVYCCHVAVARKHWLYPAVAGGSAIPLEFAFGPLTVHAAGAGCDLRPSRPGEVRAATSCGAAAAV